MTFRWKEGLLTLPSLGMLVGLVGVPTLVIFITAFCASSPTGGVGQGWSFRAIESLFQWMYVPIIIKTLLYSAIATLLCILIGLPVAYLMARCQGRLRNILVLAIVIPFWTNMLVHLSAWKMVLHPNGAFGKLLLYLGVIGPNDLLLYNPQAVILLFVYIFLPFAIIPLYATIEKFDFRLLESARDLGATSWQALSQVFLPGIWSGILSASILVFVPVLGCYVVPELVGDANSVLYSNKIAQRTFQDRNLPEAAALSSALLVGMMVVGLGYLYWERAKRRQEEGHE
ncbi:MAG: ABC transporter permease [Planctomycetia bacterium]|nr:ABC transporter permease [Planctomycetia bacterium]